MGNWTWTAWLRFTIALIVIDVAASIGLLFSDWLIVRGSDISEMFGSLIVLIAPAITAWFTVTVFVLQRLLRRSKFDRWLVVAILALVATVAVFVIFTLVTGGFGSLISDPHDLWICVEVLVFVFAPPALLAAVALPSVRGVSLPPWR